MKNIFGIIVLVLITLVGCNNQQGAFKETITTWERCDDQLDWERRDNQPQWSTYSSSWEKEKYEKPIQFIPAP